MLPHDHLVVEINAYLYTLKMGMKSYVKSLAAVAVVLLLGLIVAACGDSSASDDAATLTPAPLTPTSAPDVDVNGLTPTSTEEAGPDQDAPTPSPTAPSISPTSTPVGELEVGSDIGDLAPDFSVPTLDGQTFTLSDALSQGKPAVIYFFATW